MTEYIVKIGFWLRAYDGFTIEAKSDADAIEDVEFDDDRIHDGPTG